MTHPQLTWWPIALLATAAAASGQTQPPSRSVSTAVHEAWLQEVMDLDIDRAIKTYSKVIEQSPSDAPERWIAVSRLAELHRAGIQATPVRDLTAAPEQVRRAMQSLGELPIPELLQQAASEPGARLPALHSATQQIHRWLRTQAGTDLELRRELRRQAIRFRRSDSARAERWYAYDILRVELRSQPAQAQALRTLYFADWQPPSLTGEPASNLKQARERLQAWIQDQKTSSQHRSLLRTLDRALEQRSSNPSDALAFLQRMPRYAERLLGDGTGPIPGESGASEGNRPPTNRAPANRSGSSAKQQR